MMQLSCLHKTWLHRTDPYRGPWSTECLVPRHCAPGGQPQSCQGDWLDDSGDFLLRADEVIEWMGSMSAIGPKQT